jgi:hypothetical protein
MPASMTLVIPTSLKALDASLMSLAMLSRSGAGMCFLTMMYAGGSCRRPVGSPFSSFTMLPPTGWGVSLLRPAISSALLFTTQTWPQVLVRQTGLSGAASSRSHLVRSLCSASLAWSQPRPWIHSPGFVSAAFSFTAAMMSAIELIGGVLQLIWDRVVPLLTMCRCESIRPGRTIFPFRSMISVASPLHVLIS